ncbi:MAG TPA: hypothetical protein VFI30_06200 [Nocardioidaceae bacterium]|nr:hypothetical protein [Nocardioidaceae bacterium]
MPSIDPRSLTNSSGDAGSDTVVYRRPRPRLELSGVRVLGGALAAASAAVAASWLGVGGTIIGAAVASVVATVGTALYSHSLERSRYTLLETIPTRLGRHHHPGEDPASATETRLLPVKPPVRPRVQWGTVALSAAVALVLGIGLITAFEAVVGRPVSALTSAGHQHGTTITRIIRYVEPPAQSVNPTPPAGSTSPATTGPTTAPATTPASPAPPSHSTPSSTPTTSPSAPATPTGSPTGTPTSPAPSGSATSPAG